MLYISSTSNAQVKELLALQKKAKERTAQDVFIVEGPKMFLEAPAERLVQTFASETFYKKNEALFEKHPQPVILADRVFESVSDTRTPQGVLCIIRQYHYQRKDLLGSANAVPGRLSPATIPSEVSEGKCSVGFAASAAHKLQAGGINSLAAHKLPPEMDSPAAQRTPPLLMILENLQDPGNLGTILRTAEGAGVTGILMSRDCVDICNPKVIRSTMGSVYRMPFYYSEEFRQDLQELRRMGVRLFAAHLQGSVPYDEPDYRGPSGFMIGNESRGLTDETAALTDTRVRIPMCGRVESLNAAAASAILMYEANRQRRADGSV